jgi:hypothetical protein
MVMDELPAVEARIFMGALEKKVAFQYGESSLIHDGLNLLTMITLICIS